MGTIFKSWLIANFEIFVSVIVGIICVTLYAIFIGVWHESALWFYLYIGILILLPSARAISPPRLGIIKDIIALAVTVWIYIYLFDVVGSKMYYTLPIAAILMGILAGIYSYNNFDDVTSSRMLYHNSSVSLFTQQLLYAFDRFFGVFFGICFGSASIIGIIGLILICKYGSVDGFIQ
jgi:hypothetical protein